MWVVFMAFCLLAQNGKSEKQKVLNEVKNILSSKTVQDYGNISADICLIMQAVGHFLSM